MNCVGAFALQSLGPVFGFSNFELRHSLWLSPTSDATAKSRTTRRSKLHLERAYLLAKSSDTLILGSVMPWQAAMLTAWQYLL